MRSKRNKGDQGEITGRCLHAAHSSFLAAAALDCWSATATRVTLLFSAPDSSKSESPPYSAVVRVPKAAEVEWILDLNEEENELVRSEFYYEQVIAIKLDGHLSFLMMCSYGKKHRDRRTQPGLRELTVQ